MQLAQPNEIDAAYFAGRRDKAIQLAAKAKDAGIKAIHLRMAERYAGLANPVK